jgi:putative RNA 2'-phosphotransferase
MDSAKESPMDKSLVGFSKFLSYVLRHKPESIDLTLDEHGWADVEELIQKANSTGKVGGYLTLEHVAKIVQENEKKRFTLEMTNEYSGRIRANQGHSIAVDVELKETVPPTHLYHGTASKNVDSIYKAGLLKGNRNHVHLSSDVETARNVGSRHGSPVVLTVKCDEMLKDGYTFYRSENGVWLVDHVPSKYILFSIRNKT